MAEVQTGSVKIPLHTGMKMDGALVKELTMREPTVDDQLASQAAGGSEAEQQVVMIANLCMVTPKDIRSLTLRDYQRTVAMLMGFID
jgi:phage FluMu protein gp41